MCPVNIRISHNNNLIITKLSDIKIIPIAFGKSTAKGIDHRLDFCIGEHLINACFFHI